MESQKPVQEMTDIEIKAMIYDKMVLIEQVQNDIKALNQFMKDRALPKAAPMLDKLKKIKSLGNHKA